MSHYDDIRDRYYEEERAKQNARLIKVYTEQLAWLEDLNPPGYAAERKFLDSKLKESRDYIKARIYDLTR